MESRRLKLIPSIYVADGQVTTADSRHVRDYNQAMSFALECQQMGADELIIMDVTAISDKRRNLPRFLKDLSKTLNIPYTFGGGINTVADVDELMRWGAQRVYVNSAAVRNPELIYKVTSEYGKNALMVAVDSRLTFGTWKVYLSGGKSRTEIDLINWLNVIQLRGANQVLVSAISKGNNEAIFEVFSKITEATSMPVLASASFTKADDFARLVNECNVKGLVSAHFLQSEERFKSIRNLTGGSHDALISTEE
jgi:cyclase